MNEIAQSVQRALGRRTGVEYAAARYEVLHAFSDHSKAESLLGYEPKISLDEGVATMAVWALKAGPRQPSVFSEIEIARNLPEV